jgi:hypothetical protein
MKKLILIPLLLITTASSSQVFNTSSTLRSGHFSLGFEPSVYINGASDFNLFIHGGVGLTSNIDLGLHLGVLGNENYIGADVEFGLGRIFSFTGGVHDYYDFGLDGTLLCTLPIQQNADIFIGLDTDIVFADEADMLFWLPLGVEINIQRNMDFILETEIGLGDTGTHFIGGGLCFYF